MKQDFQCCICLDNYDELKKIGYKLFKFPNCCHQICDTCLAGIQETSWEEKKDLSCPLCRQVIQFFESNVVVEMLLPYNFLKFKSF